MFDLAICVALAWLTANIILIVDLRSLCSMLQREREERIETEKQRKLEELARARIADARHAEMMSVLLANIVPERPVSVVEVEQPIKPVQPKPEKDESEDAPQTQREPAAARSQHPPAPALHFPKVPV